MTIRKWVSTLLATVLSVLVMSFVGTSTASAAVGPGECRSIGTVNGYALVGEPSEVNFDNVFNEWVCRKDGMRLYRSLANTHSEFVVLRQFASEVGSVKYPTLFCKTAEDRAYLLDLAYFYGDADNLNQAEKQNYREFALNYADSHGCRVFQ